MGIRYCLHCGMPVPRRAKICPECGTSLNVPVPHNTPEPTVPRSSPVKPKRANQTHRSKQNKNARPFAAVVIAVCCAIAFFILNAGDKIENARSRHRENMMDAERNTTTRPASGISEFSMPDFSFPDIQLPKPPPAAFTAESYEVKTNPAGETVLYVNINYTNLAEEKELFLTNFRISVQQNGEECTQTAGDFTPENHLIKQVQPDETVLISAAFLISAEQETTISVCEIFGEKSYLGDTILPHADGTVTVNES